MNLILYVCCQERDRTVPDEQSVTIAWSEAVPKIHDVISMGKDKRWFAVDVLPYQCAENQAIGVYLVHVHLDVFRPAREEWDSSFARPDENIHIELSGVGEPELQLGFNVLGRPPQVGNRLVSYKPLMSHSTQMKSTPTAWVIDRYDEFLPVGEAPYKAIYLSWCKQQALVAA
jgi:hypothetical protein